MSALSARRACPKRPPAGLSLAPAAPALRACPRLLYVPARRAYPTRPPAGLPYALARAPAPRSPVRLYARSPVRLTPRLRHAPAFAPERRACSRTCSLQPRTPPRMRPHSRRPPYTPCPPVPVVLTVSAVLILPALIYSNCRARRARCALPD
ncbi:unnamed protein product [Closterium sp. NIES-64]|nr:unnamed protein product [Closterium sp. NIES-64]